MRFNLVQLRAFVAAAEALNFTVAADRVHVAQPTFSATIRNLEEEVGARLFERSSRKVRLTQVGAEFLPLARQVLDDVERASIRMADLVSVRRGAVRFSALPVLYAYHLNQALLHYREAWPGVRLELFDYPSGQALEQLRREQLDVAIVTELSPEKDMHYEPLCERSIVAVLRPDHLLAKEPVLEWKRVLQEPTALLQGGGPLGNYLHQTLFEAGLKLVPEYRVDQIHTAMGIVSTGLALGVMSNITAVALAREGLVVRELVNPVVVRPLSLASLATRELPPAAVRLRESVLRHWHSGGRHAG
ncbi:LysR family transcriptional regulator [Comamonadaceae bacterium G21597-S1]|nr:LysR family transcriptional regulator [Comamonadaceae bacterium G21597-S1]